MKRSSTFRNLLFIAPATVLTLFLLNETNGQAAPPFASEDFNTSTTDEGPVIDLWYGSQQIFGQLGIAQRWINILGNVADDDGVVSLSYSLNNGPPVPLSIGPGNPRLVSAGDFNVEIAYTDLLEGQNQVGLTATDNLGNTTIETMTVEVVSGRVWPQPYSIDWSSVAKIQEVAQIVDGKWALQANTVRPAIPGYDRLIAIGDLSWSDYEITVPITIHGFGFGVGGSIVGIVTRWDGHDDWGGDKPVLGWYPMGAIMAYEPHEASNLDGNLRIIGDASVDLARNPSRRLELGVPYIFKVHVETTPGLGGLYKFKVWQDGQPEPAEWDLSGQEGSSDPANGSLLLVAHNTDASFGNVTVTAVGSENGSMVSDDFNSPALNSELWSFIDPLGDAVLTTGGELSITVPAGSAHDVWDTGNLAPRIMQPANDSDFEIEVKFVSAPSQGYQLQGVLIEENSSNFLRFDFHHDGASCWIFAASLADGSPSVINRSTILNDSPLYMRVKRQGDQWLQSYSYDKRNWLTNANFTHVLSLSAVGVFVGNAGSPAPAYTGLIDYFANTESPLIIDLRPPVITGIQLTHSDTSATIKWRTDEPATSYVAYGRTQAYERGSVVGNALVTEHVITLTDLMHYTLYHFRIFSADLNDNVAASSDSTFVTTDVAVSTETPTEMPTSFELHQNYPNPFNPATTIEYSLPSAGFVTLKVFAVSGEEVTVLVAEELSAGRHKVRWNATGLASGVYFCRLSVVASGKTTPLAATKKLVLIK